MRKIFFSFLSLTAILINNFTAKAQCSATIRGTAQVGSILKANTSSSDIQLLNWQSNGATVYNSYASFNPKAITVAGGRKGGTEQNQLSGPGDVQVDESGNIYVLDGYSNRVQKWIPGATSGVTVAGGNGFGSGANQLFMPHGFYVDKSGNIYVADLFNNRVQKWSVGATSGITVAGGNGYGAAANQLASPNDVFVDNAGNVYVTDGDNHRVQKWAPGATSGITVAGGNGYGAAANQLNTPYSLYVDKTGNIYVSDRVNNRIQKWAAGAVSGITVAGVAGIGGSDSTRLNDPRGIFVDANGIIYIADYFNHRVQKWVPAIGYGITVAGGNGVGRTAYQLYDPSGVFVSANGNLFVADEGNNRIQKFTSAPVNNKYIPQQAGAYKVVAIFSNGCSITSKEVIVVDTTASALKSFSSSNISIKKPNALMVYPNPAHQYATLQFSAQTKENYFIEVADFSGRIILHNNGVSAIGNNEVKLDVSELANGVYIISIFNRENSNRSLKLYKK